MCPSNETSSPRATVVTSSPTTSTVPAISCPWMRGGLILPSDHASQSKMWRSVPQIDAIRTRTRASSWRIDGLGTVRTSVAPRAARILTAAVIVSAMAACSTAVEAVRISTFYRHEARGSIPDDDEEILPLMELRVERLVPRVHAEDGRRGELPRRGAVEEGQEARLVEVLRDRRAAEHGIDPEERLLEPEPLRDRVERGPGAQEEQGVRLRRQELPDVLRELREDVRLGDLRDHELPGLDEMRLDEGLRGPE